jgi:hypothetical protein
MKEIAANNVTQHLLDAIERVRDDVAKVEFWAGAVAGFSQPVPAYEPEQASVWLPSEQATSLRPQARANPEPQKSDEPKPLRQKPGSGVKTPRRKAARQARR